MRLLSLVEATPATGLGRLARSLALRESLLAAGHELVLAGDLGLDGARTLLDEAGARLDGQLTSGAISAPQVAALAESHGAAWAVVDCASYPDGLTELLAARGVRTAWFHDGIDGAVASSAADLVIAPEWATTSSVHVRPNGSTVLRGPDYAPVRAAAREAQERREARAGGMGDRPRLVVLLGDEETAPQMLPVAEWVAASDISADVLCVGGSAVQRRQAEVQSTRRVRILATAWRSDLPRLVADHDLVVTSGRRFSWEIACIGTPMALLALRPDAAPGLEAAVEAGAAIWLGRPGDQHSPAGRLRQALRDGMRRREVAATAARLVDGSGADRIAAQLTAQ